jgi:anti-sigma B factor antagonist
MKFDIHRETQYSILTPDGEKLDSSVSPDMKSNIIYLANTSETGHLIIDLTKISFADSSGLSSLLLANRLYRDSDKLLVLCSLHERIRKLIEISQLTSAFNIVADRAAAELFILENTSDEDF